MRAIALSLLLLAGAVHADAKDDALRAGAEDCVTTGAALALGLSELNPLGPVAACVLKPLVVQYANQQPEPYRTDFLTGVSAVWTGAAANNVIAMLGGGVAGPAFGLAVALGMWASGDEEREFARLCAYHRSVDSRVTTCTFTKP